VRLPDPEWDRIEELTQQVEKLRAEVERLEAALREHNLATPGSS
jgi:hypothetical protein